MASWRIGYPRKRVVGFWLLCDSSPLTVEYYLRIFKIIKKILNKRLVLFFLS